MLRLRDDLAGMRVKCPECGDAVDVPEVGEESNPFATETGVTPTAVATTKPVHSKRRIEGVMISGNPVNGYNGFFYPTMFGTAELTLGKTRLVEETKKLFSSRYAEFRLREIESAEILTHRNSAYLMLGILTLGLFGFGLLFFIAYFLVKCKLLMIYTHSRVSVIGIKGDDSAYYEFIDQVLTAAEQADQ